MHDEGLVLDHLEFALESVLKLLAVVDLLNSAELEPRVHDLVDVINLNQVARSWQPDLGYLLL